MGFKSSPDSYIDPHLTSKIREDWGSYVLESSLPGLDNQTSPYPSRAWRGFLPGTEAALIRALQGPHVEPSSPFPSFYRCSTGHCQSLLSSKYFLPSTSPTTNSCLDLPLPPWLLLLLCYGSAVRLPQGCPEPASPHRTLGDRLPCSLNFHLHTNGPSGLSPAQFSLPAPGQIIQPLKIGSAWRPCTTCSSCPKSTVAFPLCPPPYPSLLTPTAQLGIPTHSLPQARCLGTTPECSPSSWLSSLRSCQSVPSDHAGTQASFRSFRSCLFYTLSVPQTSPSPLPAPRTSPFRTWAAVTDLCHQPPERLLWLKPGSLGPKLAWHLQLGPTCHPRPASTLCPLSSSD